MLFRDLKTQYKKLQFQIDNAIQSVLNDSNYISGKQVGILEKMLAEYIGVKHCITCANGTDALEISLMTLGVNEDDAVFVPDFTFFSSGEAPAHLKATPVFVDVDYNTYNISPDALEKAIQNVINEGVLKPKVIIAVDLFGVPADYVKLRFIANKYNLVILEDGAQSFGAELAQRKACSFGDISTTSFFPAKPLGCYGDGGAIFTDNDEYAHKIRSLCVHGKGYDKYHNIYIGRNSRLDTIQAAILIEKLKAFKEYELEAVNRAASIYSELISNKVKKPLDCNSIYSSWAQYTICLRDEIQRTEFQTYLKSYDIPTNIYYSLPMHKQKAFNGICKSYDTVVTDEICKKVISIPIGPYITDEELAFVSGRINEFIER